MKRSDGEQSVSTLDGARWPTPLGEAIRLLSEARRQVEPPLQQPGGRPLATPPPLRGFILQPTYRVESGRPVVHLYGRLEEGIEKTTTGAAAQGQRADKWEATSRRTRA